jgi:ribosome-binding protein aMBF1 (putative translation factor)
MITALQCKLGRTALGWNVHTLAKEAQVGANTVSQFERSLVKTNASTINVIEAVLAKNGIVFINNSEGEGIFLRAKAK